MSSMLIWAGVLLLIGATLLISAKYGDWEDW